MLPMGVDEEAELWGLIEQCQQAYVTAEGSLAAGNALFVLHELQDRLARLAREQDKPARTTPHPQPLNPKANRTFPANLAMSATRQSGVRVPS